MANDKEGLSELNILEDFQWDDKEINFFGEGITKEEVENQSPEKKEEKTSEKEEKKSEEEPEEKHEFGFEDKDKEDSQEVEKKPKADKVGKDSKEQEIEESIKPYRVVDFLVKQGIIEMNDEDLKEFEELDDIDKEEVIKDYYFKAVEDKFEEDIKNLPEIVKNTLKIAIKGGDVDEYLAKVYTQKSTGLTKNMNLNDELNQEKIVMQKLVDEGYDEDYIQSQIDFLKDSDKLQITAEKHYTQWKKAEDLREKEYLRRAEENERVKRDSQIDYRKSITQHLSSMEDIKGFKITKKETTELPDYVAVPNIKTSNGQVITGFQKDLFEAMKDKDKVVLMAKLLRSDFDFSSFEKNIKSEQTKNLKENIQRQKTNKDINSTTGSSQKPKRLVDFFE